MFDRALLCALAAIQPVADSISLPPNLGDMSAKVFVALVVLMVLTGRLVPGKERDIWRDAFLEASAQKGIVLRTAEVTQDVLQSIPGAAESGRDR